MAEDATPAGLEALLDAVHAALCGGLLQGLPSLADRLEAALPTALAGVDTGTAGILRQKARRNAGCLTAATAGLRAAQRRLRDIAAAAEGGSFYDGAGKARRVLAQASRLTARF
jgi:hypothetical protein